MTADKAIESLDRILGHAEIAAAAWDGPAFQAAIAQLADLGAALAHSDLPEPTLVALRVRLSGYIERCQGMANLLTRSLSAAGVLPEVGYAPKSQPAAQQTPHVATVRRIG